MTRRRFHGSGERNERLALRRSLASIPGWTRVIAPLLFAGLAACSESDGRTCVINSDCPPEASCVAGTCVAPEAEVGCTSDAACAAGESCDLDTGQCERTALLSCGDDRDCPAGERCSVAARVCVAGNRSCTDDETCEDIGQVCDLGLGQCVDCIGNQDCVAPDVCREGSCVDNSAPSCLRDAECAPPATVCEAGMCSPGCTAGGSCETGTLCDESSGRCVPEDISSGCLRDADCDPPSSICEESQCVPGCETSGCNAGETCDRTSGRCVSNPTELSLNERCASNSDCESGICFEFGGSVGRICVAACGTSLDCPSGFTCGDFRGAKSCLSAQFFSGATFASPAGSGCRTGSECRSGYCGAPANLCIETCAEDSDCSGGGRCRWEEIGDSQFVASCSGPLGLSPGGSACRQDTDCQSGVCYGNGTCGALCGSTTDCGAREVCIPVNYSRCVNQAGSTCLQWAVHLVKACVEVDPTTFGSGAMGSPCTTGFDCRDGFCDTQFGTCVGTCSRNADCPANMRCGIEQYGSLGGDPVYFNVCLNP